MLFPKISDLLGWTRIEHDSGRRVAIRAGQRSGKTKLASIFAVDYDDVVIISATYDQAEQIAGNVIALSGGKKRPLLLGLQSAAVKELLHNVDGQMKQAVKPTTLVIVDEPWWMGIDVALLHAKLNELSTRILSIGSRGPTIWNPPNLQAFASWDLNPNVTFETVEPLFRKNWVMASRDFGLEDSRDADVKARLLALNPSAA